MALNVGKEIAALKLMTVRELREKCETVFGEPTRARNRDFLFKRIAWRIQSQAEGDLSERARRRAEMIARDADLRTTTPRTPLAGPGGNGVKEAKSGPGLADRSDALTRENEFEIVSLVGTLCPDGVHVHIALSNETGRTIGGHLLDGCIIYTTAEIVIGDLQDVVFTRDVDPLTTYKELMCGVGLHRGRRLAARRFLLTTSRQDSTMSPIVG